MNGTRVFRMVLAGDDFPIRDRRLRIRMVGRIAVKNKQILYNTRLLFLSNEEKTETTM